MIPIFTFFIIKKKYYYRFEVNQVMSVGIERRGSSRNSSQSPPHVSPYEFTKTGVIGDQRDTMLQSELQILVCIYPS
jgi:hypothetical protein